MKRGNLYRLTIIFLVMPVVSFGQLQYSVSREDKGLNIISQGKKYFFSGAFSILYSSKDPGMALRPAGIQNVPYNVPAWISYDKSKSGLKETKKPESVGGDGFDDRILKGDQAQRTSSIFNSGLVISISPLSILARPDSIVLTYPDQDLFALSAVIKIPKNGYPLLSFTLCPHREGFFSVGYSGVPAMSIDQATEIWQPLIWQEKRFPDNAYLTPAHMATLPLTMVNDGTNTLGAMAAPQHLPFASLPLLTNSQFGIAVRDAEGLARPQVFAPILGGSGSRMNEKTSFKFNLYLVVEPQSIAFTYETLARNYFGFRDLRRNDISTLNQTLDNIIDYSMSEYAWFIDSLKGCAYSTDVPGAVKNVSSLNPLELSIVMDNKKMFEKRAYPLIEYMLSREKFLFSLDSTQKIQSPSRKLAGPVAPLSELAALYRIFDKKNPLFVQLAEKEYGMTRERNLDVKEKGANWITSMHLYKATGDKVYLGKAISGADAYLAERVYVKQTAFADKLAGSFFFWPSFTNRWIELVELYELTGKKAYLNAAHEGARYYTMFAFMTPKVPQKLELTVNKGGKAPMYWYLKSKGHNQMYYPEEKAPAWRLSETGLTPESSGTSSGHRAIFMANYAPWMLRISYYTNDNFLKEVAKSAVIGRYRNFPGYHINTARTTAYEKYDFPLHAHKDLSVNSFHYNHILPMASMLLDYLVTDAFARSAGEIDFPSEYIEGYAYLQNKMYGSKKGSFYNEKEVQLWMPQKLIKTSSIELNYISGYKEDQLFIALMNQCDSAVNSSVVLNDSLLRFEDSKLQYSVYNGSTWEKVSGTGKNSFDVKVEPGKLTVVRVEHVIPGISFQNQLLSIAKPVRNDLINIDPGRARAVLFRLGEYKSRAYVYLQDDDTVFSEIRMNYQLMNGRRGSVTDKSYPFEFTVDLPATDSFIQIQLEATRKDGRKIKGNLVRLGD